MLCPQILIKLISIGSYFPKVRAFGTVMTSTEVFRLIVSKLLTPPLDDLYMENFDAIGSGCT